MRYNWFICMHRSDWSGGCLVEYKFFGGEGGFVSFFTHTEIFFIPNSIHQNTWFFEVLCYYMNVFLPAALWIFEIVGGRGMGFSEILAHEAHVLQASSFWLLDI
jgi:hypothetical protein